MPKNVVGETVTKLGGVTKTAAAAEVAIGTVNRALELGRFTNARACVLIARVLHPSDGAAQARLIAKLAGLPD
jgi:hypothetical protein